MRLIWVYSEHAESLNIGKSLNASLKAREMKALYSDLHAEQQQNETFRGCQVSVMSFQIVVSKAERPE